MGEADDVCPTSCPGLFILSNCLPVPLHRRLDSPHSQLEEMEEKKISSLCWKSTIKTDYFVNFLSITQEGGQAIARSSYKNKQYLKAVIVGPHTP